MSGLKNEGQILDGKASPGNFDPNHSQINFAVPTKSRLFETESVLPRENIKPGILEPLLDSVSAVSGDEKSHKLCVDGKKINPSTLTELGQIDLFGFEDKPTASDLIKRK